MTKSGSKPRTPPHDPAAEMGVLGSMLLSPEATTIARSALETGDFYSIRHQHIFDAISSLSDQHDAVDTIMLRHELESRGTLPKAGGAAYLLELMEAVPTSANVEYYCDVVKTQAAKRALGELSHIGMAASVPGADRDSLVAKVRQVLDRASTSTSAIPHVWDGVDEVVDHLEAVGRGEQRGLSTGIPGLDHRIPGIPKGSLVFICGRPSSGKTALACNILVHAAVEQGLPSLFFSAEMGGREIRINLLRMMSGVNWLDVVRARLTEAQLKAWGESLERLRDSPLWIDDTPNIKIEELFRRALSHDRRHPLGLIVVDYVQILRTGRQDGKRHLELAWIVSEIKRLARTLDTPVIVLSQVGRPKGEEATLPKGSGAIEEAADVLLQLHGKKGHGWGRDEPDIAPRLLRVEKFRNGPTPTVGLNFNKPILRFERWEGELTQTEIGS